MKMTREHRAWEMLIRRLDYLNGFGGNRSEMEKTTRIVAQIWDDAGHEEEPEDPDHYPVENIGFDNTGEVWHEEENAEGVGMTDLGCDYRGMDFGARYIDSCCIDGYLWDLDSSEGEMLYIGGDIPCPKCNHDEWLEYISDSVIDDGYDAFFEGKADVDCPYFDGCTSLKYPNDWEVCRRLWLKGFYDAQKEKEDV